MRSSFLCLSLLADLATFALGATVVFPVKLTWEKGAPDGFERDMILINGQFPGPALNINEGDNVEFVVTNQLPYGTTIHFHGVEQYNTPWSDGVPGLSQTHIQPGNTFTYKWTATQYGTYWYHGHTQGQLEDGLFGAIHIQPKSGTPTPFTMISNDSNTLRQLNEQVNNPQIVMLSDWSHFTSQELHDVSIAAGIDPLCGDSILINGKGNVNCPGVPFLMSLVPPTITPLLMGQNLTDKGCLPLTNNLAQTSYPHNLSAVPPGVFSGCNATTSAGATIEVDPHNGWVSLNFISTASIQEMVVSIDDHPMWLYAVDGRYVEPQKVDAITFSHGSRYAVMVQLSQPSQNYILRVAGDGLNQKIYGQAVFHYIGGKNINTPHPSINYAGTGTASNVTFLNDLNTVPFPSITPSQTVDQTYLLLLNRTGAAWQWSINDNTPFNDSLEDITPLLWNPNTLANTPLAITTKNNTWVDLILTASISGGLQPRHPIHKHSNKAFIIGYGTGEFPYSTTAEAMKAIPGNFNLENPAYRDGFYTLPIATSSTWMVVRYFVQNPGAFLLHCHINPHLTGGMGIAILDGIDKWPTVPAAYGPGGNGS
ncbi:laccase TilA [Mollisia scopiformis]|uniref:Laccase TilA n=1 Tax=Mollisia scopiformis TaxID=149040 RepID=A0A132B8W4_MOLSC|nr:laccase TilA [Mollisia scopiformis]KUJ08107.1 laccase TilA [Mollisia scopiformis]